LSIDDLHGVAGAADSASVLASGVAGERKGGFADELFGIVVVLDLDAVIGMVADAARSVECVRAQSVLVPENRKPAIRTPQDLTSNAGAVVEAPIGLPSIHEPRLDLQVLCRIDLDAHSVKEPRRVRRNIRRLVSPIVEVVVAEQTDIGHEDSRVHVDSMQALNGIRRMLREIAVASARFHWPRDGWHRCVASSLNTPN
jgi:hypothetical protein